MASVFRFDDFELDLDGSELRHQGEPLEVERLTIRLLELFVRNPGRLITKSQMISFAWPGRVVSENALTVAVSRLRKVLARKVSGQRVISTIHGRGYRFLRAVHADDETNAQEPPAPSAPASPPIVGRERALSQLRAALQATEDGTGAMWVLSGATGVGKTRVAEAMVEDAVQMKFVCAWGYCRELGTLPPLWPIVELLREVIDRLGPALAADARFQALAPELRAIAPELADIIAPDEAQPSTAGELGTSCKYRKLDVAVRTFALAAEHQPLLLLIDDLQQADEASLEFLEHLLPGIARARILLVATACLRETSPPTALCRLLVHRNCSHIPLPPLSEAHVASYLSNLLGEVDERLAREVYRSCEGNAFYMVALARQLRHGSTADAATLAMPDEALEVVRQPLARLSPATRSVLTACALIGRTFSLALLQALLGQDASELMQRLDEAIAHQVITRDRRSALAFTFTHNLLRAALYESIQPSERRSSHLRLAQILDQRRALAELPISELAYHSWRALPEGDLRKTVSFCLEAAKAAMRMHAGRDAARFLQYAREALELTENASPRLRFSLLWRQAAITRVLSTREFIPLAAQLLREAREQGGGVSLAQATLLLDPLPGFPRVPAVRSAVADALDGLPPHATSLRAALLAQRARSAPAAYDEAVSGELLAHALQLGATSPELTHRFSTLFAELYLLGGPLHETRAARVMTEIQRSCRDEPGSRRLPAVLVDLQRAVVACQNGAIAVAVRALERCEVTCRELDCELLWYIERASALLHFSEGDSGEAREALQRLHRRAQSDPPIVGTELFCAYDQAVVLAEPGLRPGWQRVLSPDPDDPPNIWAMKVRALTAAGSLSEARSVLELVSPARLSALPCDRDYLGTLGALARCALDLDADDYAAVLYALLQPFAGRFAVNLSFHCEGSVSQLLGMLARRLGDRERAREHLTRAVSACEKAGFKAAALHGQHELECC